MTNFYSGIFASAIDADSKLAVKITDVCERYNAGVSGGTSAMNAFRITFGSGLIRARVDYNSPESLNELRLCVHCPPVESTLFLIAVGEFYLVLPEFFSIEFEIAPHPKFCGKFFDSFYEKLTTLRRYPDENNPSIVYPAIAQISQVFLVTQLQKGILSSRSEKDLMEKRVHLKKVQEDFAALREKSDTLEADCANLRDHLQESRQNAIKLREELSEANVKATGEILRNMEMARKIDELEKRIREYETKAHNESERNKSMISEQLAKIESREKLIAIQKIALAAANEGLEEVGKANDELRAEIKRLHLTYAEAKVAESKTARPVVSIAKQAGSTEKEALQHRREKGSKFEATSIANPIADWAKKPTNHEADEVW